MKIITSILCRRFYNEAASLVLLLTLINFQAHAASISNSSSKLLLETNRVWINVTDSQGAFSQTLFGYRTGATAGYDYGLDGAFFNDGAIALASLIGNTRYAIQFKGLPFLTTDVVPLSFSASYNGTYTFAIDHMDGFFANSAIAVYLHDTVTNTYSNLKTGGYTFTSNAGMYNNRFELTYASESSSLGANQNTFTSEDLNISSNNADIVINSGTTLLKDINIYSINGKLLYQNQNFNSSPAIISMPTISKQPIIIKVTTQNGIIVSKTWLYL
jgi:hypothetical protein